MNYIKTLTLLLLLLTLNSCGENTTTPITKDVANLSIDTPPIIYSTDAYLPTATVHYTDSSTDDATNSISWSVTDSLMLQISNDLTILPLKNDGNSSLIAGYKDFEFLDDNVTLDIVGITDLNSSWRISSADITTTGTFDLSADANFTNGVTNKEIISNISWTTTSTTATLEVDADNKVQINVIDTDDFNVTATLFADENATMTKSYIIN